MALLRLPGVALSVPTGDAGSLTLDVAATKEDATAPRPHIIAVLQDDLGWGDIEFTYDKIKRWGESSVESTYSPAANRIKSMRAAAPHINQLASEGIVLTRHYSHHQCSPSRRSFLTGRSPLYHGEFLSAMSDDSIDLRMTTISKKLKDAGYTCYYYGKGHTGFLSMGHMPLAQGFDEYAGFLLGTMSYTDGKRWVGSHPNNSTEYSTTAYAKYAIDAVKKHDATKPMFMYLPWQAVHGPIEEVPKDVLESLGDRRCTPADGMFGEYLEAEPQCIYINMLGSVDHYMAELTKQLKAKEMWDKTLLVYSSDNGGIGQGVNYPLRGEKQTNWEGGVRVPAFVSGGFVPTALRGTVSNLISGLQDWYPTFCHLAGVDGTDQPSSWSVTFGGKTATYTAADFDTTFNGSASSEVKPLPDVDGVNLWPHLEKQAEKDAAHEFLWVTRQVLIKGDYKLLVGQPKEEILDTDYVAGNGWRMPSAEGAWYTFSELKGKLAELETAKGKANIVKIGASDGSNCEQRENASPLPCLFNVHDDPAEMYDIADANPALVKGLWAKQSSLSNASSGAAH